MTGVITGAITIEVALLVSGIAVAFALYKGMVDIKRSEKTDVKQDTTEMTTVIVKLENISTGVTEIKNEITNVKNDARESRERIIKVEESVKQAHKRLDEITNIKIIGGSDG